MSHLGGCVDYGAQSFGFNDSGSNPFKIAAYLTSGRNSPIAPFAHADRQAGHNGHARCLQRCALLG